MERFHLKPPFSVSVVRQDPKFGPQVSEIFLAWKFSPKLDPNPRVLYPNSFGVGSGGVTGYFVIFFWGVSLFEWKKLPLEV